MKRILVLFALLVPVSLAFADDAGVGSSSSMIDVVVAPAPAPATPPVVTIDPAHPVQSVETAWSEVRQFGFLYGGMMMLFAIGTVIIKKNDETHWLSQDHYLPIGVGVLGTLGAVINAKFAGGSWAAVVSTLMATVALIIQKPNPGRTSTATPAVT